MTVKITVCYTGSSLLAPLRQAERELNGEYDLGLTVSAYNLGISLGEAEWQSVERDLGVADLVFVIHVLDGENASRLLLSLAKYSARHHAVVVINCMPDLMRRTRMGSLQLDRLLGSAGRTTDGTADSDPEARPDSADEAGSLLTRAISWMGEQARSYRAGKSRSHTPYLKLVNRLPHVLRFVPNTGKLRDVKHYLYLLCYFLQPTPANIRSMLLYAIRHYTPRGRELKRKLRLSPPETRPAVAVYHPDAPSLFESFASYRQWYERRARPNGRQALSPERTIGLLLMRPQIVSETRKHYDYLIRAIEDEGLAVIPAISTLMDNREACEKFFVDDPEPAPSKRAKSRARASDCSAREENAPNKARVSQIVSLTGFSFVGGPAMNDSEAACAFLRDLNRPFRSVVSLDMQTIESWRDSGSGLNPVQAGMQVAIPELDGATEPFVYGGMPAGGDEPLPLEDRCRRVARRLKRWNKLRTAERAEIKIGVLVFCFPPNKGNLGTAADLDVFPSAWEILKRLRDDGYALDVPRSAEALRGVLLGGNSEHFGAAANVAYRMTADEYRRLCPYVDDIEREWGPAPGSINSFGGEILIQGIRLGNVFLGVQPTFGYEGDPMRMLMARGASPHHGFMALYTYLDKVFGADAVVHLGTHGSLEFMPGKQVGLSAECWPDRLIGDLPHIYLYSVNNPSEGSIAKRRSYAELVSYLTPPIENAGLYKDLAALKDLLLAYRQAADESERAQLYASIDELSRSLNLSPPGQLPHHPAA